MMVTSYFAGKPLTEPTDAQLALESIQGDAEAYAGLVRRYQAAVFSVCYRMLGERGAAEDMAQETFLRAFLHLESYQVERPFGPWIRKMAANLCINQMKAQRLLILPFEEESGPRLEAHIPGPEDAAVENETARGLAAAIRSLRPAQRAVIELSHFQEMSYAEIAAALGLPLSDVKSHLFRARKRLAEILQHV